MEFGDKKKIFAMFSAEKEKVHFVSPIDPVNKNVEDWMCELESMMQKSVRDALLRSITDYAIPSRNEWVLMHPG